MSELHTTDDLIKDQTYFLSHLNQEQLSRALFPLGHLTKVQVRELASQFDLPNKDRKDSQGICFLGKLKFPEFVKHHMGEQAGPFIEVETGKRMGTHKGFWFYTIGPAAGHGPEWRTLVCRAKSPKENIVFISRQYYTDDKMRDTFVVSGCNWIAGAPEKNVLQVDTLKVKLRHGPHVNSATLEKISMIRIECGLQSGTKDLLQGQYAVFYEGTHCLGGGVITHG